MYRPVHGRCLRKCDDAVRRSSHEQVAARCNGKVYLAFYECDIVRTDILRAKIDMGPISRPVEIGILIYPEARLAAVHGLTDIFVVANRFAAVRRLPAEPVLRVSHWHQIANGEAVEGVFDTIPGPYNRPAVLIAPPDGRFEGYFAQFGHDCWELDALDPNVIADLIRRDVEALIDPGSWDAALESENRNRHILARASQNWAMVEKTLAPWKGECTTMKTPAQFNSTPITTEITRLITTGTTQQALLTAVAYLFPELTPAELSQALQVATTAAERQATRSH
jgi:hypothetical protein